MDEEDDPVFLAWVALHEWLLQLAEFMREEARVALAAAARLDPGR